MGGVATAKCWTRQPHSGKPRYTYHITGNFEGGNFIDELQDFTEKTFVEFTTDPILLDRRGPRLLLWNEFSQMVPDPQNSRKFPAILWYIMVYYTFTAAC